MDLWHAKKVQSMDYGFDWFKSIPQWLFGLDAGLSEKVFLCKLTIKIIIIIIIKIEEEQVFTFLLLGDPYPVGHKFLLSTYLETCIQLVTSFYFPVAWRLVSSWSQVFTFLLT